MVTVVMIELRIFSAILETDLNRWLRSKAMSQTNQ